MQQFINISLTVFAIVTPVSLIVALGWLLYKYHVGIGKSLAAFFRAVKSNANTITTFAKDNLLTVSAFFRYAVLTCLAISIIHGNYLFTTSNHDNNSLLNSLFASVFDITIWVLIEAMIKAKKQGFIAASIAILGAIILVSSVSFTANIAYNRHFYDASLFSGVIENTDLRKNVVTVFQSSPPLMLILISVVAEYYTKTNVQEVVTRKERLTKRYMRKVEKLEAKLEAENKMKEALNKFNKDKEKQNNLIQPVRFSILGVIKVYGSPVTQPVEVKQITETMQKLSVSIVHLENKFSSIYNVTEVQDEQKLLDAVKTDELSGVLTDVSTVDTDKINKVTVDVKKNYFADLY